MPRAAAVSVEEEVAAETAAAQAAAADDVRARSVGLHLRGRGTVFKDSNTNEYDPERSPYHQVLSDAALHGEYERAEEVMGEMAAAGDVPGARAYHALVYAHVRGGQAGGALDAIRRCWDAGVTPLPETYAAVVLAHVAAGDLDTAEAVLASNRRAGVDCTKSWQQLVAALFREGRGARALEAYSQVRPGGCCMSKLQQGRGRRMPCMHACSERRLCMHWGCVACAAQPPTCHLAAWLRCRARRRGWRPAPPSTRASSSTCAARARPTWRPRCWR